MAVKKENKIYHLMSDEVARHLFKNSPVAKELTAYLVSGVLGIDYEYIINNIHLTTEEVAFSILNKDSRADVMLESNTFLVDIEICYTKGTTRQRQMDTYIYEVYLSQVFKNNDLRNMKKVIQIMIENYDYFHKGELSYEVLFMEKNLHLVEDDNVRKFHLNVASLENIDYNSIRNEENVFKKILYMFVCPEVDLDKAFKGDSFMEKVIETGQKIAGKLNIPLYLSEEEIVKRDMIEAHDNGYTLGKTEGKAEGLIEGSLKAKHEAVINMHHNSMNPELIAKCINLPINDVLSIINNNDLKDVSQN